MKKLINLTVVVFGVLLIVAFLPINVSAQKNEPVKTAPASLPADVSKVITNSCVKCHMEPGNSMALTHLNFSKWDDYDAAKQASKAAKIKKMVSKGKMPPKGFRKDHPDLVPSDADKKVISDWANSLKPKSK